MKGMCTYTHMTKYVEDKWNELKTHVTKLVSDKSTETTAKLKADYNAKFSKQQDEIDALQAQVAALTARSAFDNGTLGSAPAPEKKAAKPASKPAAKRAPKAAAKQAAKVIPQKQPVSSPNTSKGVQKRKTYYRPSKAELQKRAQEEAKETAEYEAMMEKTKDETVRQTRSMLYMKDKRMHVPSTRFEGRISTLPPVDIGPRESLCLPGRR
jgi:hypothetical protein